MSCMSGQVVFICGGLNNNCTVLRPRLDRWKERLLKTLHLDKINEPWEEEPSSRVNRSVIQLGSTPNQIEAK